MLLLIVFYRIYYKMYFMSVIILCLYYSSIMTSSISYRLVDLVWFDRMHNNEWMGTSSLEENVVSSATLNIKPASFSEILLSTYQGTSCHIIAAYLHHIFKVNQLCMLKFLPIFSIIITFNVRLLSLYIVIIKASFITYHIFPAHYKQ